MGELAMTELEITKMETFLWKKRQPVTSKQAEGTSKYSLVMCYTKANSNWSFFG